MTRADLLCAPVASRSGSDGQASPVSILSATESSTRLLACPRSSFELAGFDVPESDREFITNKLHSDFSCMPVYLSADVAERYYNGFSNSILWPLFHCEHLPRIPFLPAPDIPGARRPPWRHGL